MARFGGLFAESSLGQDQVKLACGSALFEGALPRSCRSAGVLFRTPAASVARLRRAQKAQYSFLLAQRLPSHPKLHPPYVPIFGERAGGFSKRVGALFLHNVIDNSKFEAFRRE